MQGNKIKISQYVDDTTLVFNGSKKSFTELYRIYITVVLYLTSDVKQPEVLAFLLTGEKNLNCPIKDI